MGLEHIAKFFKNHVADLNESIQTALEGLGDGLTCNLAKTQAALNALAYTTNAIEDICILLEDDEEPAVPKDPIPNDPLPDDGTSTSGKSSASVNPNTSITQ